VLDEGSILAGLIFAAIGVFVIEREWQKAAAFAGAGAPLTWVGFMHGPAVSFVIVPVVALAYALAAAFLLACGRVALPLAQPALAE
jgi:adenine/guanine/hypoxanthine permease